MRTVNYSYNDALGTSVLLCYKWSVVRTEVNYATHEPLRSNWITSCYLAITGVLQLNLVVRFFKYSLVHCSLDLVSAPPHHTQVPHCFHYCLFISVSLESTISYD